MQMFVFADTGFATGAYPHFWTWAVYVASLYVLLRYMARRYPAAPA